MMQLSVAQSSLLTLNTLLIYLMVNRDTFSSPEQMYTKHTNTLASTSSSCCKMNSFKKKRKKKDFLVSELWTLKAFISRTHWLFRNSVLVEYEKFA